MRRGVVILAFLVIGCGDPPRGSTARFCDQSENQSFTNQLLRREYIDIDIAGRKMHGADVSSPIESIETKQYFGMVKPLPVIVPRLHLLSRENPVFRAGHGNLSMTFRVLDSERQGYIGEMYEGEAGGRARRVLIFKYTPDNGVYEIRADPALGIASSEMILRKCAGAPLFAQPA